jgi:hypothetical protein
MPDKKKYKIICDSREKKPISFEHDDAFDGVIYKGLSAGDYSLEGYEHLVTIERKNSVNELFCNLSKRSNLDRFIRELDRMPKYRFILIEAEFSDLFEPSNFYINVLAGYRNGKIPARRRKGRVIHPDVPRMIVLRRLTEFMINNDVKVIFVGKRIVEMVKYILLEIANKYPPQEPNP